MNTESPKKRIGYIDLAKGIAILSMVFCHICGEPYFLYKWIYSFHMPIFFIISGLLLSKRKEFDMKFVKSNFINKVKTIIWPYFVFSLFYIFISIFIDIFQGKIELSFLPIIKNIIYNLTFGYLALWFLPCIFIANILFSIIHLISKKWIQLLIDVVLLILSSVIAMYVSDIERTTIIYFMIFINRTIIGYLFIEIGYYLIKIIDFINIQHLKLIIGILCIEIDLYTGLLNIPDLIYSNIGNPILYYFNAIIGSLGILLLCNWIDKYMNLKLLKYYGEHTIIVLVTHILFVTYLFNTLKNHLNLDYSKFVVNEVFSKGYFIGFCLIEIPIIILMSKYCQNLLKFPNINKKDIIKAD